MSTAISLIRDKSILNGLAQNQITDLLRKLDAVNALQNAPYGKKVGVAEHLARTFCVSVQAVLGWQTTFKKFGPAGLVDGRRGKCAPSTVPNVTREWWKDLILLCQRNDSIREARRQALDQWRLWRRTGDPQYAVPGYTTPPSDAGRGFPDGWSEANFRRSAPTKYQRTLARQGRIAADRLLPSIQGTRVGTKYLEVIYFDDQKYDHQITAAGFNRPMVPMGFNALDKLTAYAFQPYIRLRWLDEEKNKHKELTMREFMWYVIHILTTVGYRTDEVGTTLVKEHGTANTWSNLQLRTPLGFHSFEDAVKSLLDGHVTLDDSGLYNTAIWQEMLHGPQPSGNPRFKAPIESFFHLVRNYHLALPGQTGRNIDEAPEENYGLFSYERKLAEKAGKLPEALRHAIRSELFTFSEYGWFAHLVYQALNERTDHVLKGWEECGFVVPVWKWEDDTPDTPWRSRKSLANLPEHLLEQANHEAKLNPSLRRPMRFSPADAMHSVQDDPDIRKIKKEDAILLVPIEWARPVTVTRKHEIIITDPLLCSEQLTYFSELTTAQRRTEYLQPGDKVLAHINPFDLDCLLILDQDGSYLGTVTRSVDAGRDRETTAAMFRERARLSGNLGARTRHAMSPIATARQINKQANDDLIEKHRRVTEGKPATEAEKRSAAVRNGQRKAAAARLQEYGKSPDYDSEPAQEEPTAFDQLPDDDQLPDAF